MKKTILSTFLFTLVALLSFAVWAAGTRWYTTETGMYTLCALVFFGFGGLSLVPASGVSGRRSVAGFCFRFALGFIGYAVIWSLSWFTFQDTFGEIIGSFFGLLVLVAVMRIGANTKTDFFGGIATVYLWHTLGYYTGGLAYQTLQNRGVLALDLPLDRPTVVMLARFSWGLFYGLGLGYGLVRFLQASRRN